MFDIDLNFFSVFVSLFLFFRSPQNYNNGQIINEINWIKLPRMWNIFANNEWPYD